MRKIMSVLSSYSKLGKILLCSQNPALLANEERIHKFLLQSTRVWNKLESFKASYEAVDLGKDICKKQQSRRSSSVLSFTMNNLHLVQLNGEKESNMMARKLIQADKKTELQPNPCSSKSCSTYVGTKTIQDLNIIPKDFAVESQRHSVNECDMMVTKPKQAEEGTKFHLNYNCGRSSAPHLGWKARRRLNLLNEDEEERRIRRVLANRESARQAILRRQAHLQELARRAAELECENNNLKKEKELALKKYQSLRSTNEILKAQLKLKKVTVNVEVAETQEALKFKNARKPTPTCKSTPELYLSNQPSSLPYVVPFIIPGSVFVQSAPQNGILNTSQIYTTTHGKTSFLSEHKNPVGINVPGTPYILPHPWLFPLPYYANGVQSLDFASKRYISKESSTSSFQRTVADVKDDQRFPLKTVRGEASASTKKIGPSVEVYSGKASGKKHAHKHKVRSEGNKETVIGSSARQMDTIKSSSKFITSAAATGSSSQKNEDTTDGSLLQGQMDAFTAAEARKRRKEVIKTKNFHYARRSHVKI
ncbi:uncharacterized protein LOC141693877 isoform X2 [Apium graveolens]|uniref:uncharacterized protein LOC141693877 isoform X2 n=1 Tax=Apium graveolens TaxID=4045 RepID=UPI003D78B77A